MSTRPGKFSGTSLPSGRRHPYTTLVLIVLLVVGVVSFTLIYYGPALCIGCPTNVVYNGSGSQHTLKTLPIGGSLSTQTLTGGSQSWPIGSAATTFSISGPLGSFGTWVVALPGDSSQGTSSSYVFTSSYSGTAFLNANNNPTLWAAESSNMGGQNPVVLNATYTSTSSAPTACNAASSTNVCKVTWFINRYYFTVDMKTAGASLYIACQGTCAGYSSFFGALSNKAQYDAAFQSGMLTALATINTAAHLSTPTDLSLTLNLPPLPGGQSNLDVAGILAAWTAPACTGGSATPSGGTAQGDLCTTSCGAPAGCSIVESQVHNELQLYADSGLTKTYVPNCLNYLNAPTYTASQLAGACSSSIASTVYTTLHLSDFGAGFAAPAAGTFSNCGISSFSSCWSVTPPEAVITVLLDVLTSYHVYTQYPTPAPTTTTNAGAFDGQVIDSSLPWKPGIAGASVCLTDITGCVTTAGDGTFTMPNVPAGQHTVQISAPNFFTSTAITVNVATGSTAHLGQVGLNPTNPWYLGCWQIVAPAYPGAFQICIPWVLVFSAVGILALAVVVYIVVNSPGYNARKVAERLTPRHHSGPTTPAARGFVSRRISFYLGEKLPAKTAQARAFSDARAAGYHVPPPPKN